MVKSKTNTKKAVFIAALFLSVIASALAPVFLDGNDAQGRFQWGPLRHEGRTQSEPVPPITDRPPVGGPLEPAPDGPAPELPPVPQAPSPKK